MGSTTLDRASSDVATTDKDKFAHYANKVDITRAMVEGIAIRAICGYKWVPTREASSFPVCGKCKDVYDAMPA